MKCARSLKSSRQRQNQRACIARNASSFWQSERLESIQEGQKKKTRGGESFRTHIVAIVSVLCNQFKVHSHCLYTHTHAHTRTAYTVPLGYKIFVFWNSQEDQFTTVEQWSIFTVACARKIAVFLRRDGLGTSHWSLPVPVRCIFVRAVHYTGAFPVPHDCTHQGQHQIAHTTRC